MKVIWAVLCAVALAGCATSGKTTAERSIGDDPLTVMTFNLRYADTKKPHAWPDRRPIMRDCIRTVHPDVIGTQEGLYGQLKDIAADLPDYSWIGTGRDGGSRGEFMAVFYRKDRLVPLDYDYFWLSDTPNVIASSTWGNTCRRMVTLVKFEDLRTKQQFYFIDTHLDHQVQAAREKAAELILKRVLALKTPLPVLLVGDFNALNTNKAYSILVGDGAFSDTWYAAAKRINEDSNSFTGYEPPVKKSERIDWILSRGPVGVDMSEVVTYAENGETPSDHFPVMAKVKLGKIARK